MLRNIWTNTTQVSDALLSGVAEELSNNFEISKINTRNRLNHFMAQVFQEVGANFLVEENLNYRPETLRDKFSYYAVPSHRIESENDGYIPRQQVANVENIANKAYANRGNNGDVASGDGWRYRGRGIKQLTFRSNYRAFTNYHERIWGTRIDFEATPDLLFETVYAVRSALFFWESNNLHTRADNGITRTVTDSITRVVNRGDDHYTERHNNLERFLREGIFDEVF
jgi:putative chitinase